MDFLQLAKERYSVRKFSDKKLEKEKLDLILEAGRIAPTAANYQPQRILVIESEENLNKVKSCTSSHFNAPLILLICYDSNTCWTRKDGKTMGEVDASIVTTQMMLEAAELGLGSTWVGAFSAEAIIEQFKIPENLVPVALLPIGYPAEDSVPSTNHNKRYDMSKTVFYESY